MNNLKNIVITDKLSGLKQLKKLLETISINEIDEVMKTGKAEKWAVEEIEKHVKKEHPSEYNIYIELGKSYLSHNTRKAIESFEEYVKKGGTNEEVLLLLGKLLRESGDCANAKTVIDTIEKETVEVLRERVKIGQALQEAKEIIAATEKIIKEYGINAQDIEEAAQWYLKVGENKRLEYLISQISAKSRKINLLDYEISKQYYGNKERIMKLISVINHAHHDKYIKNELISALKADSVSEDIMPDVVEALCKLIEEDDTNRSIIQTLGVLLRKPLGNKKETVIEILRHSAQNSAKARAGNIFLNEAEILERKIVLKSKPRQMIVELTTKCNIRCIICELCKNDYTINSECFDYIKSVIPYLERVKWQGGEVFLYKNFKDLLTEAAKYHVPQFLQTNGMLVDKSIVELAANNNIHISFSIDAVDKELYEKIRTGASYKKLISNLELFYKYKTEIKNFDYSMIMVIMSVNYHQITDMVKFAQKYGIQAITLQQYVPYSNHDLCLNAEQSAHVKKLIKKLKSDYESNKIPVEILTDIIFDENSNGNDNAQPETQKDNNGQQLNTGIKEENPCTACMPNADNYSLYCVAPWTAFCIYANNTVRLCCRSTLFDVSNLSYFEVWNSDIIKNYRQQLTNGQLVACHQACQNIGDDIEKYRYGIME